MICKPYPAKYRLPVVSFDKSGTLLSGDHKQVPKRGYILISNTGIIPDGAHVLIREGVEDCRAHYAQLKELFYWSREINIPRFVGLRTTTSTNLVSRGLFFQAE